MSLNEFYVYAELKKEIKIFLTEQVNFNELRNSCLAMLPQFEIITRVNATLDALAAEEKAGIQVENPESLASKLERYNYQKAELNRELESCNTFLNAHKIVEAGSVENAFQRFRQPSISPDTRHPVIRSGGAAISTGRPIFTPANRNPLSPRPGILRQNYGLDEAIKSTQELLERIAVFQQKTAGYDDKEKMYRNAIFLRNQAAQIALAVVAGALVLFYTSVAAALISYAPVANALVLAIAICKPVYDAVKQAILARSLHADMVTIDKYKNENKDLVEREGSSIWLKGDLDLKNETKTIIEDVKSQLKTAEDKAATSLRDAEKIVVSRGSMFQPAADADGNVVRHENDTDCTTELR